MPSLGFRSCPEPGCRTLTQGGGRCLIHARALSAQRGTTAQRGYDAVWKRCRLLKLGQQPLCEECLRQGQIRMAEEVDHIVPIAEGGDRLDFSNLQSLCKACHSSKTVRESRSKKVSHRNGT